MPPSSKRVRAARRAVENHDVSDAETPESIATPSRPTRKRGRGADAAPASAGRAATRRKTKDTRLTEREDTEGTEAQENSDAETEPAVPSEEDVISKLKESDKFVFATQDFANDLLEGREHVPGYGKIAGRTWTYIIKDVEVNIGRPEQHEKAERGDIESSQVETTASHKSKISIDLGPDRQTSRLHATIAYDGDQAQWYVVVNGRNGLRVDTQLLKRGSRAYIRSGSVIDICGTQMAFITTATGEDDGPVFADAIIRQTYTSEEDDNGDGEANGQAHGHPPPHGPSSARRGPGPGPGFSDDQPSSGRIHPHSQVRSNMSFAPPGTPIRGQHSFPPPQSKPSPASNGYARGVMIESTESIDYAADAAKDLKPPHSYAQLIGMAILSTSEQQMTLNNIYKWIMANYAFYRFNTGGWQNSIRHNLSLNKAFEKIARRTDEPGKGMKWMIAPKERETFLSQGMKGCRRPNPLPPGVLRNDSDPSSPTAQFSAGPYSQPRTIGKPEETASPPLAVYAPAYPTANEAYTPDRGSRRPLTGVDDHDPEFTYYPPSAKSTLNHLTAIANAAGSPPALYTNEEGRMGMLDTPFPIRSSQKLMPPSTLQRPSAFMDFSSPAPFWKFGSTPLRPLTDMSPMKTPFSTFRPLSAGIKKFEEDERDEDKKAIVDEKDDGPVVQSSSPPRPASAGDALDSPSRTISRPVTSQGRLTKAEPSPLAHSFKLPSPVEPQHFKHDSQPISRPASQPSLAPAAPIKSKGNGNMNGGTQINGNVYASNMGAQNSMAHAPVQPPINMPRYEADEEDGIDLVK